MIYLVVIAIVGYIAWAMATTPKSPDGQPDSWSDPKWEHYNRFTGERVDAPEEEE